jgi:hypothetical protein
MTIDVRAKMICSLGRIVEGSVSDDLLQDSGIVRVQGDLTISGVKNFARGQRVELAYKQDQFGTVTRFPRPLRVLKCTADPYRNKTAVEVGCKLALMESRKVADVFRAADHPPDWWSGTIVPVFSGQPIDLPNGQSSENYVTTWPPPPISAQLLLEYCLQKIGIKLAKNSEELTFYFSRKEIDLSSGYVSVISDLLKSHCMYGRLNAKERLVVKRIAIAAPEPGPTLKDSDLIDLEPIAGGDEPSDTVLVSYEATTRKGKRNK